jgi:IclR family transcriptional regulator, KDG regulon repressor
METHNIRSVERAIDILEVVKQKGKPVGVTEISQEIGLAKSTVYRLLETLLEKGMVNKDQTTDTYTLGIKLLELAFSASTSWNLINLAMPYLEELRDKFNETISFAIKVGLSYCHIAEAVTHQEFRVNPILGRQYPLHWSGTGKAILANISDIERDEALKLAPTLRSTPNTITDPQVLIHQIEQIRKNGYAVSFSERAEGAAVIASPVCDKQGYAQAAICLVGPEVRLRNMDLHSTGKALQEMSHKIEMVYLSVGYNLPGI